MNPRLICVLLGILVGWIIGYNGISLWLAAFWVFVPLVVVTVLAATLLFIIATWMSSTDDDGPDAAA